MAACRSIACLRAALRGACRQSGRRQSPAPTLVLSQVSLELTASPMLVLPRRVEHALNVAIQCPHDTDAREHCRTAVRRDQDQGFHCSLPFRRCVIDLRKSRDVVASVLKGDQHATAGQGDWLIEDARPGQSIHFRRSRRVALAGRILPCQPLPATIAAHPRADLTASSR
jgi:hypothetical protein